MCSYNRINGDYACENTYILHDVLKKDWGYKGFVISDWGGTHSTEKASAAGMDQEQPMADYFGPALLQAVKDGKVPMAEIDDHARRVLYAEFLSGIVDHPIEKGVVDVLGGLDIAQQPGRKEHCAAQERESDPAPGPAKIRSIAVIGGHADVGMISGGGSAQVDPPGGNAIMPPGKGATHWQDHIWFPTSPLKALRAKLPNAKVEFDSGQDASGRRSSGQKRRCRNRLCLPMGGGRRGPANPLTSRQSGCVDRAGRGGESTYDCCSRNRHCRDHALDRQRCAAWWKHGSRAAAVIRLSPTC